MLLAMPTPLCIDAFHDEFQTASGQGYALTAARLSFMAQTTHEF
jgi:hypothetical protein